MMKSYEGKKILQYMCPGHHYRLREKPQWTIIFYPNLVALRKNALFPGSVIGLINRLAVWWTVMVGEGRRWNYTNQPIHRSYRRSEPVFVNV
jgi:hypothetical protein